MSGISVQSTSTTPESQAAQSSDQSSTADTASSKLNMNSFLTMFATQLQYQDPTNPLQSHELAAQLAQFSTVEKLTSVDKRLYELELFMAALNNAQMMNAIGKEVTGVGNEIRVTEDGMTKAGFQLNEDATKVTVKILSESGETVKTWELDATAAGDYPIEWDGKNDAGEKVPEGTYTFQVDAVDGEGEAVDATTTITGTAYSLRMVEGIAYLVLGDADGILLPTGSVMEVQNSTG
jgi:flagellar basal-body rod modification protein FlgD